MNDFQSKPPDPQYSPAFAPDPATDRHPPLRNRWFIAVCVVVVLGLAAWLLTPHGAKAPAGGRYGGPGGMSGPMPVAVAQAKSGTMPIVVNGLGTVTPVTTVTVQSQISGQIVQIAFKEGQSVRKGDLLMLIDPRPYQVALEQAEGALARDKALLANARTDLERYTTLFSQDSIAEQQLATQKALVAQDEGTVKTDQAAIDAAKLNLIYCHITSPVDGRAGLQQVTLGNYVTPAEANGLVVVTQLKPITVVFALPEDEIPPIQEQLQAGKTLPVTAFDRAHVNQLAVGALQSLDSQIDTTTGTLKLKAVFANPDEKLFPNQFVNVDLLVNTLQDAVLIPQQAVQRGAPGTFVYVANADRTVSVRKVTLGPGDPTNVSVQDGLKVGETVVIDGADRLKDGAKILVRGGSASQGQAAGAGAAGGTATSSSPGDTQQHQHRRGTHGQSGNSGSPSSS
ncbi:MAG: MdtA/MuxA family multidrug efflux RND transporter periplasmic adaptor subunit [Proteobacteria bacterium]|nr:MdtA/MuxA family multidrug efflux RND transporter periplasmic adaptor subunit [Pseudomonadota bacterium]